MVCYCRKRQDLLVHLALSVVVLHEVTYTVIDNKTGVKFSRSCTLRVRSPFARG